MVDPGQYLRMRTLFGMNQPPVGNDLPLSMGGGGFFGNNMGGNPGPNSPDAGVISPQPDGGIDPSEMQVTSSPITPDMVGPAGGAGPTARNPMPDMASMFNPHYEAEQRYNDLAKAYPNRKDFEPSVLRRIGGALMAFSGGMAPGRGLNFYHANPNAIQAGINFMDKPFSDKLEDWKAQMGPAMQAATLERYQNANERQAAYQNTSTDIRRQAEIDKAANDARKAQNSENRTRIYQFKAEHPNAQFAFPKGGNIQVYDPATKKWTDSGMETGTLSDMDKMDFQQANALELTGAKGAEARKTEALKEQNKEALAWSDPYKVDMPDGTTQYMQTNKITGEIHPAKFPAGGAVSKIPGAGGAGAGKSDITSQTKTMMEGSQMLLPHVSELRQQAIDLEKRGLFGPVMSRIRDLAAKVGTTGSPEEVQKNLEDFALQLANDPKLNNDAAVGQFVTSLGLMSSGMGRVHGGARGGGSIQMINYLKSLLSSDSTVSMFNGRLNAVESYLKGYAAGPKQSGVNNKLDSALDKIFGPK